MGQILNRIINLAKIYKSQNKSLNNFDFSEDAELKRIIDELNSKNSNDENKYNEITDKKMTIESAYIVLKVSPKATEEQIKQAYLMRIKEYHPDRLQTFGEEIIELAKKKTQQINEAYSVLMNKR
jgi:DnaJ-domain-containing protein 1